MALVQVAALAGVAFGALPHTQFHGEAYRLVVKLLWLQAVTAPCYGMSVVVTGVLQAARRYDFIPRLEVAIVILRFAILWAGLSAGCDFFAVVVAQTVVQVGLSLGPGGWVMVRELGHVPRFTGARRDDYAALLHVSLYIFLIQLSVVLADKVDTTILGFVLDDPGPANAVYDLVSKPFAQLRQTAGMLASMVMPAVASLAAARDARGLERIKYDGPRLHLGLLLPVALLAWIYAGPFLSLWVGDRLGYDAARAAPLMRLFLLATIPLVIVGTRPDGHRHGPAQGRRAVGPGRGAGQPADQLRADDPAGGLRRDLGHGADDALLQPAGTGDPRLPRPGDQAGDVPGPVPGRPAGRGRRPGGGDLRLPRPDPARPRGLGRPGPSASPCWHT